MKYQMTEEDSQIAYKLHEQRCRVGAKKNNMKRSPDSDEKICLDGARAEVAFCRMLGIKFVAEKEGDCPVVDTTLPSGKTVDVKSTEYEDGRLLVPNWKSHKPCDLYALVVGVFPNYRLAGAITKFDIFQPSRWKFAGQEMNFVADQGELKKELLS